MELKVRENKNGKYLILHSNDFENGIKFVIQNNIDQIQLRGAHGKEKQRIDFSFFDIASEQLKSLSFTGFNNRMNIIENFDNIYNLNVLERIYLSEKQDFKINVSRFKRLKELGIAYSPKIVDLEKAKSLETLVISEGYPAKDLSFIKDLHSLKKLHIYKSTKIENLNGIENLSNLIELKLAYNNNLPTLEGIHKASVQVLHIEKCRSLNDFSLLAECDSILELFISELNSLQFVKYMKGLKTIHFWDCKDGNLYPLFENPSLIKVSITKDKKHYSHTQEEIDRFFNDR